MYTLTDEGGAGRGHQTTRPLKRAAGQTSPSPSRPLLPLPYGGSVSYPPPPSRCCGDWRGQQTTRALEGWSGRSNLNKKRNFKKRSFEPGPRNLKPSPFPVPSQHTARALAGCVKSLRSSYTGVYPQRGGRVLSPSLSLFSLSLFCSLSLPLPSSSKPNPTPDTCKPLVSPFPLSRQLALLKDAAAGQS